jgi:hypothetical protein
MPNLRTFIIELSIMLALGLLLALLGPFGTFVMGGFAERLIYWISLSVGGYLVYRPVAAYADRTAAQLDLPRPAAWALGVAVATLPMTLVAWLASYRHTPGLWPSLDDYVEMYGNVLLIGAGITLIFWFASADERPPSSEPAPPSFGGPRPEAPGRARFLGRLPPHLGRELLALEMEDHYVRAHTANGSTLILMRLRDAVTELDGVEGMQVHRSWWVARDAVERIVQEGRSVRLKLKGGLEAPVARNSVPALRAAGWL